MTNPLRRQHPASLFFKSALCFLSLLSTSIAQWSSDPTFNTAVTTQAGDQTSVVSATDGVGGALIVWSYGNNLYAQHIDASGMILWGSSGVSLCTSTASKIGPAIVSDGAGGAIIAWYDFRNPSIDIYAQRINADGSLRWSNGVAVCTADSSQDSPILVSDGAGGAVIAWNDKRSGSTDVYAQRIDRNGSAVWTSNGVGICTATGDQFSACIASDALGGAILSWVDFRRGTHSDSTDIFAQRVRADGSIAWTSNGEGIAVGNRQETQPAIASDGEGGAFIVWVDFRTGSYDLYGQRIDSSGTVQWTANGVGVCMGSGYPLTPSMAADGTGGALVTWHDNRAEADYDIYAQRIAANGTSLWTSNGVALCTRSGDQNNPLIVADGTGGALVTWKEFQTDFNVYAQGVDRDGGVRWTTDGVSIATGTGHQDNPVIVSDGTGGAIMTWLDTRNGNVDVYASRLFSNGTLAAPSPVWNTSPTVNDSVCIETGDRRYPTIAGDARGGAFIAWYDTRGVEADIYAQRLDVTGAAQWTTDGVAVCAASSSQGNPSVVGDGAGGAIVAWDDYRNGGAGKAYDVYAQRVGPGGLVLWTTDGVAVSSTTGNQERPSTVSDDRGGAIICWHDARAGNWDVYVQRINSAGSPQWTSDGEAVYAGTGGQENPAIVADGLGGALVVWQDNRSGNYDIYIQRVDPAGSMLWTSGGVAVCVATGDQTYPQITSDGRGGAIVVWQDKRNGTDEDIYVQRIDYTGTITWTTNGVALCTSSDIQWYPVLCSDGEGGAIAAWYDYRNAGGGDIYAGRIDASGTPQWTSNGIRLSQAIGGNDFPKIISDGAGGAFVTWADTRASNRDAYAQRVTGSGTALWATDGAPVSTATANQYDPVPVPDGSGGAIITWWDSRLAPNYGIYASKVFSDGTLPVEMLASWVEISGLNVELQWNVASQIENYGFKIDRRPVEAAPQKEDWKEIGFVRGDGTSNAPRGFIFRDQVPKSGRYGYRIRQLDLGGKSVVVAELEVEVGLKPDRFEVFNNYPNPFNPSTTIQFSLPVKSKVRLVIFDLLGQQIAELANEEIDAGYYQKQWNAGVTSGLYFYRLEAVSVADPSKRFVDVKKMLLLK